VSAGPGGAAEPRAGLWLARALGLASAALVLFTLAGPLLSGDLWWHLSNGRWMLEHRRLPGLDPFSHTGAELEAETQEYGSQLLLAWIEGFGGLTGLRLFAVALGALCLWAVYRSARRRLDGAWAAAATALFAALFALKWELRPHLLSLPFLLGLEALLFPRPPGPGQRGGEWPAPGARELAGLLLLAAAWIQLHAEALFAPILAGAALGASGLAFLLRLAPEAVGGGRAAPAASRRLWAYLLAFGAALFGSTLSPTFLDSHRYALFQRSVPERFIEEWFPGWILPGDLRFAPLNLSLWLLVLAAVLLGGLRLSSSLQGLLRRRPDLPLERLAFLALCLVLSIKARRFFWLAWFPLVESLALLAPALARGRLARAAAWLPSAAAALGLWALFSSNYVRLQRENLARGAYLAAEDERLFPVQARQRLAESGLEAKLFHPYEWGGYLGFWLWPACRVFLDGRTVMFAALIPERWWAERDPEQAERVFAARDIDAIVMKRLVERDGQWVPWRPPQADGAWVRAYGDRTAELWLRADRGAALERLRGAYAQRGIEFEPSEGFAELAALAADPGWQARWQLLPEPVFEALEAAGLRTLAQRQNQTAAAGPDRELGRLWLAVGRAAAQARLGRSARFALLEALEHFELSADQAERLAASARGPAVAEALEELARLAAG
jgi:hypothetical protein